MASWRPQSEADRRLFLGSSGIQSLTRVAPPAPPPAKSLHSAPLARALPAAASFVRLFSSLQWRPPSLPPALSPSFSSFSGEPQRLSRKNTRRERQSRNSHRPIIHYRLCGRTHHCHYFITISIADNIMSSNLHCGGGVGKGANESRELGETYILVGPDRVGGRRKWR